MRQFSFAAFLCSVQVSGRYKVSPFGFVSFLYTDMDLLECLCGGTLGLVSLSFQSSSDFEVFLEEEEKDFQRLQQILTLCYCGAVQFFWQDFKVLMSAESTSPVVEAM